MENLNKIVWLASYPKSGNTWFRAFLTALCMPENTVFDINQLHSSIIASSRELFDDIAGVYSADLTADEIDKLRPSIYRQNAGQSEELIYHKIHDAWTLASDGNPLFPADITRAVIYIIRNPLDVAISFSHHLAISIDRTISIMNSSAYSFCNKEDRIYSQFRQKLLTWSEHVNSWTVLSGLPVIVIRYEDMITSPIETFSKALHFIGVKSTRDKIDMAISRSNFDELKKQEEEKGFNEKSPHSKSFFRKGIAGDWKNMLTDEQVKKITDNHRDVMKRFGYLRD